MDPADAELLNSFANLHGAPADEGQPIPPLKIRRTKNQKAAQCSEAGGGTGADTTGRARTGEAHGTSHHPARQGNPDATQTNMLRYVRTNQSGQCTGSVDAASTGVERAEELRQSQSLDTEELLTEERHTGAAGQADEVVTELPRRPNLGYGSQGGGPDERRLLAVSTLVSSGQEADPITQTADEHGQDPQGGTVAHRVVERGGTTDALPQPETTDGRSAMAARTEHTGIRNVDHPDGVDSVNPLDVDRSLAEAALTGDESPHTAARADADGSEGQEPGEGQEEELVTTAARSALRHALTQLVLDNPSHLCFANAAVTCFLWSSLSRVGFQFADWGIPAPLFRDMLSSPEPYSIDSQNWYADLTEHWEDNHGQADSAEFTQMLVQWVAPAFYCSYWHRRWMQCENVLIHDHGDIHQPRFLQLEPTRVTDGMIRLTDLLRSWHGELGMSAGLLRPPEALCVHLERMVQTSTGRIYKMQTPVIFQGNIHVPIFQGGTLDCRWETYQAVAAFAHYGDSKAGHYRALLRTEPRHVGLDATTYWLDCDDCRKPQPCTYVPNGFMAGVTCVWLCRLDVMELHDCHSDPRPQMTESVLMHMLAST